MEKKLIISVLVILFVDIFFVSSGIAQSDISIGELLSQFKYVESLKGDYIADNDLVFDKIMRQQYYSDSPPEIFDESNALDTLNGDTIDINKTMDRFSLIYHDGIDAPAFLVYRYSENICYGVLKSVVSLNEDVGFVSTLYKNETVILCFPLNKFESGPLSTKGHALHVIFFVNRNPRGRFVFLNSNPEIGMSIEQNKSITEAKYLKEEEINGIIVHDSTLLSFLLRRFYNINYTNVYSEDVKLSENRLYSIFARPYNKMYIERD